MNSCKEITTIVNHVFFSLVSKVACFVNTYMLSSFPSGVWAVATGGHRDGVHEEGQSSFGMGIAAWGQCHCTHHLLTTHVLQQKYHFIIVFSSALAVSCLHLYEFGCTRQHCSCPIWIYSGSDSESVQTEVYGMRKVFIMSEVQMNFCIVIVAFTLACIVPCHALSFT